jgi:hypothetical protein
MKGAFQMLDGEKKLIVEGNLLLFILYLAFFC